MSLPSAKACRAPTPAPALPIVEPRRNPRADATGITEAVVRGVVVEFYKRARDDERLGPVFQTHIGHWDAHLERMTDFWSAALLQTGRYSGRPIEQHRSITDLSLAHFDRWIALFESTVRAVCSPPQAAAFLVRAYKMRDGMVKLLGLATDETAGRLDDVKYPHPF